VFFLASHLLVVVSAVRMVLLMVLEVPEVPAVGVRETRAQALVVLEQRAKVSPVVLVQAMKQLSVLSVVVVALAVWVEVVL